MKRGHRSDTKVWSSEASDGDKSQKYSNGTIWCYGNCWMPLTWQGVHERLQHISVVNDPTARDRELRTIYGIDRKELQANLDVPGSAVRAWLLYTFPSPRGRTRSRIASSA